MDATLTRAGRRLRGAVVGPISHEQWRELIREVSPAQRRDRGRRCYCLGTEPGGHVHV